MYGHFGYYGFNSSDEYIGRYGQIITIEGFGYWFQVEKKLQRAIDAGPQTFVIILQEDYQEGDIEPYLAIVDVLTQSEDGKLTNGTSSFETSEECAEMYKEVSKCDMHVKVIQGRDNLRKFLHDEYDGNMDDGEYCITNHLSW